MQNPIRFRRTIKGNRLKIAFYALVTFIILVAVVYYYISFKKSHIPQTIEGTWICQDYLDSVRLKKSIALVGEVPMFFQMSFKRGWADSVICTGLTSTYVLKLQKTGKGKYNLIRYSDTLGSIRLKRQFTYTQKWSAQKWVYSKVDTGFKRIDKGETFRMNLNKILIAGVYRPILGKGMFKLVSFSDSGTVKGNRGITNYKLCYSADCFYDTKPKDAIFMVSNTGVNKYAFNIRKDTLDFYIINPNSSEKFKLYWQLVKQK